MEFGYMFTTIDNSVDDCVNKGWYSIFLIIEAVTGLVCLLGIAAYLAWPYPHYFVFPPFLIVLPILNCVVSCREGQQVALAETRQVHMNNE